MTSRHPRRVTGENTYHLSTLNTIISSHLTDLNNKTIKCDTDDVTITSTALPTGASTEAKQDDMINLLEGQTPALNRPKAIPVQIMVGDAGGSYDALRANGQDLLVMIDDMNPDVAVNSGLATKTEQQTANTSLNNIDTKVATSAKQDDMISLLEGQTPALNRTKAIPVQIMVGDAGGNYDALRANGQDLLVKVDDMDPDCAVNSGLATSAKQDTTHFLIGLLATKAEQLNQSTNLTNIDNSTSNIDGKLAKSVVIGTDGTTSAQVVMACGSNDGTNLRTIATNDTGDVRSLLVGTDNGGTTHEIITSNNGTLITEVEHSWDTETIENATTLAGGGTALTTGTLDIGQGISHEMTEAVFYITNSTNQSIDVQPQSSHNGTDWFVSASGTSVTTTQNKSFMCQNECFKFGQSPRYMRLRIVNNGASSTDITVVVGRYK